MTMGPSPEYVTRQLQLAHEALADARLLLEHHRLSAALNRSYYAMFYAAMAALSRINSRLPKSHRGTEGQYPFLGGITSKAGSWTGNLALT
jgi:uncharacterized protein (UPF0332 family)